MREGLREAAQLLSRTHVRCEKDALIRSKLNESNGKEPLKRAETASVGGASGERKLTFPPSAHCLRAASRWPCITRPAMWSNPASTNILREATRAALFATSSSASRPASNTHFTSAAVARATASSISL